MYRLTKLVVITDQRVADDHVARHSTKKVASVFSAARTACLPVDDMSRPSHSRTADIAVNHRAHLFKRKVIAVRR